MKSGSGLLTAVAALAAGGVEPELRFALFGDADPHLARDLRWK